MQKKNYNCKLIKNQFKNKPKYNTLSRQVKIIVLTLSLKTPNNKFLLYREKKLLVKILPL